MYIYSFINSSCLVHCRVYEIEKAIKTPAKYLYPNFETLHWYAAKNILDVIRGNYVVLFNFEPGVCFKREMGALSFYMLGQIFCSDL